MDRSSGQSAADTRPQSGQTRQRLLRAAAELIAELGWGRVTTRAVAERAELPHGAVSYHFRGKQELLRQAAVYSFDEAFGGISEVFDQATNIVDLMPIVTGLAGTLGDSSLTRIAVEAMRESERDPELRTRFATLLREYRAQVHSMVRADQQAGTLPTGPDSAGLATMLVAAADGLLLHALLDPELDAHGAVAALLTLLGTDSADSGRETNP